MSDRKFRNKDFAKYDKKCRKQGKLLLKELFKNKNIKDNPDVYGPDLLLGKNTFFEVEYKTFNNIDYIERNGLHISERKKKYYDSNELKVHHITFLDDYKKAVIFKNTELRKCSVIKKDCKRGSDNYSNAKFLQVTMENSIRFEKIGNTWKKVLKFK